MNDTQLKYELKSLALSLYHKHFSCLPDAVPFKPLDDCRGLVSQIDNMTTGLVHESKAAIIPEGYVLVPVEPTEAMFKAGLGWRERDSELEGEYRMVYEAYKAMIQAAQEEE